MYHHFFRREMSAFTFSNWDIDNYFSSSESGRSSTLSSIISPCDSDSESLASSLCSSSSNENPIIDVKYPSHMKPRSFQHSEMKHSNPVGDISYTLISECEYYERLISPYNTVDKGLTFQVVCRNKRCKTYNKEFVNFHLGMCPESNQVCHFAEYMFEVYCPACYTQIIPQDIYKLILKDCCVKIKFKRCGKECKEYEMVTSDKNFLLIKVNNTDKFDYFKLTLS